MTISLTEFGHALRHPIGRRGHFLAWQMERSIGSATMAMAYSCLAGAAGVVVLCALEIYPDVLIAHAWVFSTIAMTTILLMVAMAIAACITGGLLIVATVFDRQWWQLGIALPCILLGFGMLVLLAVEQPPIEYRGSDSASHVSAVPARP